MLVYRDELFNSSFVGLFAGGMGTEVLTGWLTWGYGPWLTGEFTENVFEQRSVSTLVPGKW